MEFEKYISEEKIRNRVVELAQEIDQEFGGEEVVVIGVLNGAFIFVADLIRAMKSPVYFDFIGASSYKGTESTGEITITKGFKTWKEMVYAQDGKLKEHGIKFVFTFYKRYFTNMFIDR